MCSKAVLEYLESANRPYSANDIHQNLHNAYSKSAIQNALEELAANGTIREKIYGKQKIYCILQKDEPASDGDLDEDQEEKNAVEELRRLNAEGKIIEASIKEMLGVPTTEEAKLDNERLQKLIAHVKEKLNELKSGTVLVTKEEMQKMKKRHDDISRETRKRKRIYLEIFDNVLEHYPKSKAALIEECGLDV